MHCMYEQNKCEFTVNGGLYAKISVLNKDFLKEKAVVLKFTCKSQSQM